MHNNPDLKIVSKPGIIVLKNAAMTDEDKHLVRGCNHRIMGYHQIQHQSALTVSYFSSEKRRKYHNQGVRGNISYLKQLFHSEGSVIRCKAGDYAIQFSVAENQRYIVTRNQRSEVYVPMAFKKYDKCVGGIYANLWDCGTKQQKEAQASIAKSPVTAIVSAMCMFGNHLKGIDPQGVEHPLTNTAYKIPDGRKIVKILHKNTAFHPYEKLMYETYQNLVPFYYVLGQGKMPRIFHHIPFSEYIFYGLNLVCSDQMTMEAFHEYVHILEKYVAKHKKAMQEFCDRNKIQVDMTGPMDALVLEEDGRIFSLTGFLKRIGISENTEEMLQVHGKKAIPEIIDRCLDWLSENHTKPYRTVWKYVRAKKHANEIVTHALHGKTSLLSINYLSYIVKIASAKIITNGRVCLSHPYREKQMALAYKKLLAEKFGKIVAFYWILPVFSNISESNSIYHLEHYIEPLDHLLQQHIATSCFMESTAEALQLGDRNAYTRRKQEILAAHTRKLKTEYNVNYHYAY